MRDFPALRLWLLSVTIAFSCSLFHPGESAGDVGDEASNVPDVVVNDNSNAEGLEREIDDFAANHDNYDIPRPIYDFPRGTCTSKQCVAAQRWQPLASDRAHSNRDINNTPKQWNGVESRCGKEDIFARNGGSYGDLHRSQPSAASCGPHFRTTTSADFDWIKKQTPSGGYHYPEYGELNALSPSFEQSGDSGALLGTWLQGSSGETSRAFIDRTPVSATSSPDSSNKEGNTVRSNSTPEVVHSHNSASQLPTVSSRIDPEATDAVSNVPPPTPPQAHNKRQPCGFLLRWPLFSKTNSRRSPQSKSAVEKGSSKKDTAESSSEATVSQGCTVPVTEPTGYLPSTQEELPLPLWSAERQRPEQQGVVSDDSTATLVYRDQRIRETLSPHVLNTVLNCEQRILKALRAGNLMNLVSSRSGAEHFAFFAHVASRFTEELHLTPAERLFIMWAQECPKLSLYCSHALLIEMVPLFEFIAGTRHLEVPPAVKVLLNSAANREHDYLNRTFPTAPATRGPILRRRLSSVPFTLFFHRISSDDARRRVVRDLMGSWPQFAAEVRSLIFRNYFQKSFDYSSYRTRFTVYAYTASAMNSKDETYFFRQESTNPAERALHNCFRDTSMIRRIADPEVRTSFVSAIQVTNLEHGQADGFFTG